MNNIQPNDTKHVRYYYLRKSDNHPFGCVCTIRTDDGSFFRGISICNSSMGDQFSKPTAKGIAFSRALKAYSCSGADNLLKEYRKDMIAIALSDDLDAKLFSIHLNYNLGSHGVDSNGNKIPMELALSESFVEPNAGEKRMWEDILHPQYHKKTK